MRSGRGDVFARFQVRAYRSECASLHIHRRQAPAPELLVGDYETRRVSERPRRHPELPLGAPEVRRHRVHQLNAVVAYAIEIPPARAIRDEMERSVWGPSGLKDRVSLASSHLSRLIQRSIVRNVRNPEFGTVPRHIGMAPPEPRQARAVGIEARRRIEIVAGDDHLTGGRWTGERQTDKCRHGLAFPRRVILAHADEPL